MLQCHTLKAICSAPRRGQLEFLQNHRTFSYRSQSESEDAEDLEAARAWFRGFNQSTIPTKISKTTGSRSGGSGGQHANNTDSKATTTWDFDTLTRYVPKVLHEGLRSSRYYARRSNAMSIQCDSHRSKIKNTEETWKRLSDEITKVYKERVPGTTDPEQIRRVEELQDSLQSSKGFNPDAQISRYQHKLQRQRMKNIKKKAPALIALEAAYDRRMQDKKERLEREDNKKKSNRGKPKK